MTGSPRKIWDIPGGVHPPENKAQSLQLEIGTLPLPKQLIVPLNQHSGTMAKPIVAVGDQVLKGQTIATASGYISAAVHAPTSGTVSAIDQHPVPHPSGMTALCITIDSDGAEQWIERQPVADYRSCSPTELLDVIRNAGVAGLGGAGFPSATKLASGSDREISTLIINATECEPYITADDMLMRSHPVEVVEGIQMLAHLLGNPDEVLIGIEDNKVQAYDTLLPHLESTNIELVEFPTKYPSGGEKQLIQILTGQELPAGKLPADIGIICQNVGTVHAIYKAVAKGEPLISRITTVTGEACGINRNLNVLIGTPIDFLLEQCQYQSESSDKVIMGGPMMGFALPSLTLPVIKTTNCVLAPSRTEMPAPPPAQPCIRCGICAEACPVNLLPQQLLWYAQANDTERLQSHNLFDCIECGACSYACPSHIPLVQYYRAAKGEIRHQAQERIKADRARERYEYNKLRKEQQEAEKAAKREARRLAAEQAKAQLAAQTTEPKETGTAAEAGSDVVKAAMERIAATQASPEKQLAKLERSVTSSENRLERLEQKLAAGSDATAEEPLSPETLSKEQIAALQAQVDGARLKVAEAKKKLAEFQAGDNSAPATSAAVSKVPSSSREALEKKQQTLQQRIADLEEKVANCDDDSLKTALQNSVQKFRGKLADVENELRDLPTDAPQE